jgi:DHA1 family bicyclomycin/chloramphenicol resistance-like MFS transporter
MTGHRLPLLALGGITLLGSLATHMFVPALPAAAADLGVAPAAMQQASSVYVLGLGISQPGWGMASDALDRSHVLAASVLLFLLATIAAGLSQSLELLLAARFVQGAAGAGTLIVSRAIVASDSGPGGAARSLATLTAVTLVSPALAPLCGSLIAALAGWRSLFALLALLAAAGLAFVLRQPGMPPSAPPRSAAAILRGYWQPLRRPAFLNAVAINALIVSAFYIFLAASPFILGGGFGLPPLALGLCYSAIAGAMLAGTLVTRRYHRADSRRLEMIGLAALVIAAIGLAAEALTGIDSVAGFLLPMALLGFGSGIVAPIVLASAIEAEASSAGSAASIFGAIQMLATAALSSLVTLMAREARFTIGAIAAAALAGALLLAFTLRPALTSSRRR